MTIDGKDAFENQIIACLGNKGTVILHEPPKRYMSISAETMRELVVEWISKNGFVHKTSTNKE